MLKFFKTIFSSKVRYKVISSLSMMILTTLLLSYVSYSWIRREWSPRIEQSGITIATGNTLTFVFDKEDGGTTAQSILDLLGDPNFKLKSVSNLTGQSEDFFSLDPSSSNQLGQSGVQFYQLHNIASNNKNLDPIRIGAQNGYVDVKFTVKAPNNDEYRRYIYIDSDSFLNVAEGVDPTVLSAIRISVSFLDVDGDDRYGITYIFGHLEENEYKHHVAINNERLEGSQEFALEGARRYADELTENGDPDPLTTVVGKDGKTYYLQKTGAEIHSFDEFNGDKTDIANTTLFELEKDRAKEIRVRIWVEGEDPACTTAIAGKDFNLLLKFSALIIKED